MYVKAPMIVSMIATAVLCSAGPAALHGAPVLSDLKIVKALTSSAFPKGLKREAAGPQFDLVFEVETSGSPGEWRAVNAFLASVDRRFLLTSPGLPSVNATALVGTYSTDQDGHERVYVYVSVEKPGAKSLKVGHAYSITPENKKPDYKWHVGAGVHVLRK